MKIIPVTEAEGRLAELIYAVTQGECIVLKDGDREVALSPRDSVEVDDEYDPELEAELLKAANGPFTPFDPKELSEITRRVIEKHRAK